MPKPRLAFWSAAIAALERLPQGALSRFAGRLADAPIPRAMRRPVLSAFARAVDADPREAELPIEEYPTLDAFFVRRLRPGARPWHGDPSGAGSPVDGVVGQVGRIAKGRLVQAKGIDYTVEDLLADDRFAARLNGGWFVTLYLAPRHYHRIHSPTRGVIGVARHVPGNLLPVNPPSVAAVPGLFARNERVICEIDGAAGEVAVVAVGATNVGRIESVFDPAWNGPRGGVTNRTRKGAARGRAIDSRRYDPPIAVEAGDELMAFHLGSSVVVLLESGRYELDPRVASSREIRVGDPLASAVLAV
ncbi:MAG TPA: archaetidylserine decarboxylase [Gemmatimonadota bacterium]|nr:archaetidylserine decarboxylase [Gemmatimonadota bacterium]